MKKTNLGWQEGEMNDNNNLSMEERWYERK